MSTVRVRPDLPPLPLRIQRLPVNPAGYPTPWFVAWIDGVPDFRVIGPGKIQEAVRFGLCWICGERLGAWKTYAIGPMCSVNRISSEPPAHTECADFSARACPFLTRPQAERRQTKMPDGVSEPGGVKVDRNPGVALLWTNRDPVRPLRVDNGVLFDVGAPTSVAWYCEGRPASRDEVEASFDSGCLILRDMAAREGAEAMRVLESQITTARVLLPR
jgi:hypothetical protein